MTPDGITFQRLRYFVTVATRGSLRQAADLMHLTQPALSAQIQGLEKALGLQLFERTARGVRLTQAGKLLLERVDKLVRDAGGLYEYAQDLARGIEGVVSLACYPVHIERFLGPVIGKFHQAHPRVKIDLTHLRDDRRRNLGRTLFEDLLAGEADIAMGPPHTHLGLAGVKAYDAQILALVPDGDPHRHLPEIGIEHLRDRELLIAPPGYFSRTRVEEVAQRAGFSIRVAAQSSSPPALLVLGRHGLGIPVLPDDYPLVGQQRFPYPVIVDSDGNRVLTPVWLQWRPGSDQLSDVTFWFIEHAKAQIDWERVNGRAKEVYYQADLGS